ncbi:MAG: hypothetical protein NVSMB39_2850 [Candidatus Saccharimonadales bacterium]
MTAVNLLAAHVMLIPVLLVLLYAVNHFIRQSDFLNPPRMEARDDFELEQPQYAFWAFELTQTIESIRSGITRTEQRLSELRKLPKVELNRWERLCELCARISPWLGLYTLIVVNGIFLIWLMLVAISAVMLVRYYPDFYLNYTHLTAMFTPETQENFRLAMPPTMAGLGLLVLGVAVWGLGRVSSARLNAYREYRWAHKAEMPLLEARLHRLRQLKVEKSYELDRSIVMYRSIFPA